MVPTDITRSLIRPTSRSGSLLLPFLESLTLSDAMLCSKVMSCGHQVIADIQDHISTKSYSQLAKSMATQSKFSFALFLQFYYLQ